MAEEPESAAKAAGYFDVSEWGEKDLTGAYPPGTTFDLGDEVVDVNAANAEFEAMRAKMLAKE